MPQTDEQKRFFRKARKVARRLIDDYDRACEAQHRRLAPEVDRITDEINRIVGTVADGDPDPDALMARIRTRATNPSAPPGPGPTTRAAPPAPPPTPWPQPPAQHCEPTALTAPPTPPPTPPQPTAQASGPTTRTDPPPTPKQPEPDLTARPTPPEPPTAPRPSTQTSEPTAAPEPPSPELLEVRRQIAAVEARILLDTARERLVRLNLESLRQRKRLADQEAELAAFETELAAASAASPERAAPFTSGLAATLSTTPSTSSAGAPEPPRATAPAAPSASPSRTATSEPAHPPEPIAQLTLVVPVEPSSPRPRSARHGRAAPPPATPVVVLPTVSPGIDAASDQAEPLLVDYPRPAASAPILAATPEAAHHSTAATPTAAAGIPAAPTASTSPPAPQGVARPQVAEPLTPAPADIDPSDDLPEAEASPSAPTPAGVAPPCASDHPGTETSPSAPSPASLDPLVDHPRAPTDAPATSVVANDPDPDPIAIIHQADEAMAAGDHLRAAALFAVVEDLARPAYQATGNADGAAAFLVSILRGAAEAHLKRAALADALPKSQESFALAAQLHDDEPSPVSLADLAASARVHADVLRACGRPHDAAGLIDDILLLATRARPRLHSEDLRHELKCILALRRDLERDPHRAPHPAHDAHH